jgi:DNA-binding Xre family transcriptional regulator
MKNVGAEIKRLIDKKNIKRRELAHHLEMTEANVSKIYGKASIDAAMLEKICQFIGVPVSYFFESEEHPRNMAISGNGNQAIAGHNNVVGGGGSDGRVAALEEKVALLERLLEEKERYIRLLEGRAVRGS